MTEIEKIIKKVLSEKSKITIPKTVLNEKEGIDEFYYYKTLVGGVLAIPIDSNPEDMLFVQKSTFDNSENYIYNTWANHGSPGLTPTDICKYNSPDEDLRYCLAKGLDVWRARKANGGVASFVATHPATQERGTFSACVNRGSVNSPKDFSEWIFRGYYLITDSNVMSCSGTLWYLVETDKTKKDQKSTSMETNAEDGKKESLVGGVSFILPFNK